MMRTTREPFTAAWPGPFPDRRELPREPLYDLRIVFTHAVNGHAESVVRDALTPLAGEPQIRRWPFLGTTLSWRSHQPPFRVRLRPHQVEVHVQHRIKANALSRLVEALEHVPGAAGLTFSGHTRSMETCDDGAGGGACCH